MSSKNDLAPALDARLRLFVYRHLLRQEKCPTIAEIASGLHVSPRNARASLARLSESHAFMRQENGELWRAAPFSCIPTAFPVTVGPKSWFGNCIWDALGIPGHVEERRAHRGCLRMLQLRHAGRDTRGKDPRGRRHHSYRRSCPALVQGRRFYLTRPCFCSGRNSTWIAGASSGTVLAAARSRWRRAGNWRWLWYGDRLSPEWRPKSAAEAEMVFREVGLVGEFWKLSE